MPVSYFFIPKQQVDQHDAGEAKGGYAIFVKDLKERVEAEEKDGVQEKNGCEGGFPLPCRKYVSGSNKKKTDERIPVDEKRCHRKLLCSREKAAHSMFLSW